MSVLLYKRNEDGSVETVKVEPMLLQHNIDNGLFLTKEDADIITQHRLHDEQLKIDHDLNKQRVISETKPPTFDEADTNNTGKLSNKEVREAAKLAGIKDYQKARIAKLKEMLGYES